MNKNQLCQKKKNGLIVTYDEAGNAIEIHPEVDTDTTLTKSNVAADAYEVGSRLKEISESTTKAFADIDTNFKESSNNLTETKTAVEKLEALVEEKFSAIYGKIYPVGSIYISVSDTNPKDLFGGTWTQIEDTFLLSAGSKYAAGSTGGESSHTLTISEMPAHNHLTAKAGISSSGKTFGQYTTYQEENSITEGQYWWANTDNTGGSQAHNNMPPYLAVYVWKRTA